MTKIKSFIYLDSSKMYSISSQIFEGLTEYIVKSKKGLVEEVTQQKAEIFSGRVLADIIGNYDDYTEKKFLHHYSYNLFENKLVEMERVLEINDTNIVAKVIKLGEYNFVKIKGRAIFNDAQLIEETLKSFNKLGESFGTIMLQKSKEDADKENKENINKIKDRNQQEKLKRQLEVNIEKGYKSLLRERGLNLDQKLLDSLTYIINYGYKGRFEIQIPFKEIDVFFSGLLQRQFLIEDEYSIISKYSRETEKDFTVFGILTQTQKNENSSEASAGNQENDFVMKKAVMNIITALSGVEKTFVGRMNNEYIIDPIAVYREI